MVLFHVDITPEYWHIFHRFAMLLVCIQNPALSCVVESSDLSEQPVMRDQAVNELETYFRQSEIKHGKR